MKTNPQAHSLPLQKPKQKQTSLNTSQTISTNQFAKYQFQRYRRPSLPNSIGHYSLSIRNSIEEPSTDIYFNTNKKSKFMKDIVDNYFEDTLQKIYGNQKQSQGREKQALNRNIKNISKRGKLFFSSLTPEHNTTSKKQKDKHPSSDEVYQQQTQSNELQSINSSSNTTSFLPPIYQSHEDFEQLGKIFPEMSETVSQLNFKQQTTQKILTFENQAFRIFLMHSNGIPKYRIKQYKLSGMQILKREQRALKFGIQRIWKQSQINANSFVSQLVHPLKNLICKLVPHNQGIVKFKVRSPMYRKYLLANDCLELRYFIREMCGILKKIQGRVLNNKINPSNIFILKGNRICIGQWGYSSFRDQYQIQQNKFQSRINPILKSSKQWLATPEYLSPEVLQAVLAKSDQYEPDIWQEGASSDIWSFGITLFQVLTMIPIWMHQTCSCKLKTKKPVIRAGLLGTDDRKLTKIAQKQKKLQKYIGQCLQNQIQQGINRQIVELVRKMIVYDASKRITLDQIIAIVK